MIVFRNPGLIDLRFLRTFGMSAKDNENPIGYFGTGLKYAIAILLREGCSVKLHVGGHIHEFGTSTVSARGHSFEMVTMDGEEMGFTLQLGRNWQAWMAFRELRSNALDENGDCLRCDDFAADDGETAFIVDGDAIERAYDERDLIFLSTLPIFGIGSLAVHEGESGVGYFRGVRTLQLGGKSHYTYNLLTAFPLTEDRTLKSPTDFHYEVAKAIVTSKNRDFIRHVVVAQKFTYEHALPQFEFEASTEFVETVAAFRECGRIGDITPIALHNYARATKSRPLPPAVKLTRIQESQLERATEFCKRMGWPVDEYPVIVVPHATGGLLAFAEDKKIVLTLGVFDMGTKTVAHALYEEWLHNKLGLLDETREMQTHLFRQVIGLSEQVLGEAL